MNLSSLIRKEKAYKLFDGDGLYIEVPARGNLRWRVKYRLNGRESRVSLGIWPFVSLEQARMAKDEVKEIVAQGVDPVLHCRRGLNLALQNPETDAHTQLLKHIDYLESLLLDLKVQLKNMLKVIEV